MLKAVLIDDERPALRELEYLLKRHNDFEIAGLFTNPLEAINKVASLNPQVVFLDINMPQLQGLDAASSILDQCPSTEIVFITAYDQYALEAFEIHALDYILKPVSQERFDKTIQRILKKYRLVKPPETERKFSIKTLGRFQAEWEGQEPIKWRSEKTRELFAFLLHNAGREVSREEILDTVWRDIDLEKAVHQLYNGIYYIRKNLQQYGVNRNLITIEGNYQLKLGIVEVDSLRFQQHIQAYSQNKHNWTALESAEDLYTASYLEGTDWIWVEPEREKLDQQYLEVLVHLAEAYIQQQIFDRAEALLLKAFQKNPYLEGVSKLLIRLYKLTNRRNKALKHYLEYETILREELGIVPEEELQSLIKSI